MNYYIDFVIGTIFILNIYICGMDILPDMSGYILIYIAFKKIALEYEDFNIVKKLLSPLILLSSFFLYEGCFNNNILDNLIYTNVKIVLDIIIIIILCVITYLLFRIGLKINCYSSIKKYMIINLMFINMTIYRLYLFYSTCFLGGKNTNRVTVCFLILNMFLVIVPFKWFKKLDNKSINLATDFIKKNLSLKTFN